MATFHAFCARLLQDEALEAGLDPFLTPVTPADRLALLLERIDELTIRHHEIRGNPAPLLASFVSRIDRLKDELVTCREYRTLCRGARRRRRERRRARELPRASSSSPGCTPTTTACSPSAERSTSATSIMRAFRLLHEKPHVRERISERFRHVLVDEYQDTNFAQGMLLGLLVEDHRNVTVVGDDDQAIYRFRGASQKNLLDFQREFPDAEVVRLERNHRSGRRILDGRARGGRAVPRPDRQGAPRGHAAAGCASGAAARSARRRRRWPPRPSG